MASLAARTSPARTSSSPLQAKHHGKSGGNLMDVTGKDVVIAFVVIGDSSP
jgi:hypothetical protein